MAACHKAYIYTYRYRDTQCTCAHPRYSNCFTNNRARLTNTRRRSVELKRLVVALQPTAFPRDTIYLEERKKKKKKERKKRKEKKILPRRKRSRSKGERSGRRNVGYLTNTNRDLRATFPSHKIRATRLFTRCPRLRASPRTKNPTLSPIFARHVETSVR